MFRKLRNRFLIINMSIISVVMAAAFSVVFFTTYTNVKAENVAKLNAVPDITIAMSSISASIMAESGVLLPGSTAPRATAVRIIPHDYHLSFSIRVDENGELREVLSFIDMTKESYQNIAQIAWQEKKDNSIIRLDGKEWMYKVSPEVKVRMAHETSLFAENKMENYYQINFLDVTESNETLTGLLVILLCVGLAMLIIVFIISFYFANWAIQPIAVAWDKQKQFIADASHELKTPLAIINANSDALLINAEESVGSQKKWIDYIKAEVVRMGGLISDLLYLAKTEDGSMRLKEISFNMGALAIEVVRSMEAVALEKNITIRQEYSTDVMIKNDLEKVKQVICILLDNAIKYTDESGRIDICMKKGKHQLTFTMENSGAGVPKKDLDKLFDRFYRADPARTRASGGYGLGLSIAKALVEGMGGKIHAESVENRSTTFVFSLPLRK